LAFFATIELSDQSGREVDGAATKYAKRSAGTRVGEQTAEEPEADRYNPEMRFPAQVTTRSKATSGFETKKLNGLHGTIELSAL